MILKEKVQFRNVQIYLSTDNAIDVYTELDKKTSLIGPVNPCIGDLTSMYQV